MAAGSFTTPLEAWPTHAPALGERALGYVRREPDAEDGLLALFRQSRAIEQVCRDLGLDLGRLLSDEPARGRAEATTPALRQALARIVAGEASTLVVARLDSLADSAAAVGAIMDWLARKDVRFIAADHGLDTATPAGRVAASALSAAGELEHHKLKECTLRGLEAAREKGARCGRPAVADRPELRERIRGLREQGRTLQAIADELNAEGIPTLRGGTEWRPSSVQSAAGYKRPARPVRLGPR